MKAEQLREILFHVTGEVLEKLAFIFSYPEDEEENDEIDRASLTMAEVSFSGPYAGTLVMAISTEVLPELSANMLGIDDAEEITADTQAGVLKEVINIVCGNLLPKIFGRRTVFDLQPPEVIADPGTINAEDRRPLSSTTLLLDDGVCEIFLFIDGETSSDALTYED